MLRAVRDGERWFMDYRNADGSLSEMCGNGIRVFARYLLDHEGASDPLEIDTRDGIKDDHPEPVTTLTVDMGIPEVFDTTKVSVDGVAHEALHVSMGNPHAVAFVDYLDRGRQPARRARLRPRGLPRRRQRRVRRTPRRSTTSRCASTSAGPARPVPAAPARAR